MKSRLQIWKGVGLLLLVAAAGLGLYARFAGLGLRQLAEDEFFFVTSVRSIMEHGVPRLIGGGFYTRGLLPQYATAAAIALFGDNGFAYRLPAVLFNLAAVCAAYVLARRYLSRPLALLLPALLLVSSWEVEFARFARMYTAFQFATLVLLVVMSRILAGDRKAIRWLPPVILLNLLTHELAVIYLPFLALPVLASRLRNEPLPGDTARRFWYVATSSAVLALGYALGLADLRNRGVSDPWPIGFEPPGSHILRTIPLAAETPAVGALLVIGALFLYRAYRGRRERAALSPAAAWAWATLVAASIHSLLLVLVGLTVLVGRYSIRNPGESEARRVTVAALGLMAVWTAIIVAQPPPPSVGRALLGWPNLLDAVVHPWRRELPVLGLIILVGLVGSLVLNVRSSPRELARHPAAFMAYALVALGTLHSSYVSTRYTFFVYPVALLIVLMFAARLTRPTASISGVGAVLLFAMGGDFNPGHLTAVQSRDVSWRIHSYEGRGATWYPRWDFEGPAEFIDSALVGNPSRAPIIVVAEPAVSEYLDSPHAIFYAVTDIRLPGISRERGNQELWTGNRLLSTAAQVRDHVSDSGYAWIVIAATDTIPAAIRQAFLPENDFEARYLSRDGRLRVLRITARRGDTVEESG